MRKRQTEHQIGKIEIVGFTASVGGNLLFQELNFNLPAGTITLLYGPRGSGKSALLRSFARLNEEVYPKVEYSGYISFDGRKIEEYSEEELRQLVTYFDTNFLESMDFLNFKEIFQLIFGRRKRVNVEEYASLLDSFGVLKALVKMERTPLSSLYVLEKIGLLLFIASLKVSSLLIFDCLLDHLDDEHADRVTEMLSGMRNRGKIVVISTRTLRRFVALPDKLLVMKHGRQLYFGDPKKFILEESV